MTTVLTLLQCLAIAAVLWKLLANRVRLPVFGLFLLFDLCQIGLAFLLAERSADVFWIRCWIYAQFGLAIGYVAIADEARRRIVAGYPGIGMVATVLVLSAIAISILMVGVTAVDATSSAAIRLAIWLPRIVSSVLALAMGILALLIKRYPTDLSPNHLNHGKILLGYLSLRSITLLAVSLGAAPHASMLAGMVLSTCCFVSWAVLLKEEEPAPVAGDGSSPELSIAREQTARAIAEVESHIN